MELLGIQTPDHHRRHKSFGICNVWLPKSYMCPDGQTDCEYALPSHHTNSLRWSQYNVLSFDSVIANGGHIGGRVAARNYISINGGFLIGDQVIEKPWKMTNYSFVSGRSALWDQGTLLPDSESAFVGGNFTGPDYLQSRISATCGSETGCLDIAFIKAQFYYVALSNAFASLPSNVDVTYQYNGIYLSCGSPFVKGPSYVANIDVSYFEGMTWYSVNSNCNDGASWVMNVIGSGDMIFQGGAFPGIPDRVLYNINPINGTGRNVVVSTGVNGNILAPLSPYTQNNGNTEGLVIVGDLKASTLTAFQPLCNHTRHHRHHRHADLTEKSSSIHLMITSSILFVCMLLAL